MSVDQVMREVVLITGTSSGIGAATAVAGAVNSFQVVATMRDLDRADGLRERAVAAGVRLDIRQLDVTDDESVRRCVSEVVADYGRLDALVNNAGAGHLGTVELDPVDAFRRVCEVNLFGVVRTTRAVMPHLRDAGGRLVTVSSVGGIVGQPFNEAYCAAKFAVEGMMESLAPVAARLGVRVSLIEPGAVGSEFVNNIDLDQAAAAASAGPYEPLLGGYLDRVRALFADAQDVDEVAAFVLDVLADPKPVLRYQTSEAARRFVELKLADVDGEAVRAATAAWLG